VRRISRLSWFLSFALLPVLPAEARDRLVMPYDCRIEAGDVRLSPAGDTSYSIVGGRRDEQTVTTCLPNSTAACRTVMVHRFDIACAGRAVPWTEVVATIGSVAANRVWLEDGHLNLVMPARRVSVASSGCGGAGGGELQRKVVLSGDCLPWPRKAAFEHLVLPEGYAPVGELGARLMIGTAADEAEIAAGESALALTQVAASYEEIDVAKADPSATLEPAGRPQSFETVLEPDIASNDWITVVHSGEDLPVMAAPTVAPVSLFWTWVALGASAGVIALLLMLRYGPMPRRRPAGASTFHAAHRDLKLANASDAVAALLKQTETAARGLKSAGPLREVLLMELDNVRERLANADRQAAKGEISTEKSSLQFRAMVREIERIRRIVDSALASISDTRKVTALPRTTSEAYEVLGVNAEVSAGVLKKIVDALRMSWHPDHARDESDRVLREDRIRQINIAWDLINGKREAA